MSEIPPPTVPPATPPPPGGSYTPPGGGSYVPPPPPPPPPGGASGGSSDRTLMLILSYLGILALIPLLTKKDDREVQWHAKNGLALFIAEFVLWIALHIIISHMPIGIGCGVSMVSCAIWCAFLVIWVLCIVKAVQGQRFRIPVISDFADKL